MVKVHIYTVYTIYMPLSLEILAFMVLPGMVGGLVRGLVGITKRPAGERISFTRLLASLLVATIVGAFASLFSGSDWRLALLAGYAGADFLESLYKSKLLGLLR